MMYLDDLRDVNFNLFSWLPLDELLATERFGAFDRDDLAAIVTEALKVCRNELAPANGEADHVGARWKDGGVTLPEALRKAFAKLAEGGWIGATASPDFGGMGLPDAAGTAVMEFLVGSNPALSLTVMLTRGSAQLVESFGSPELKALCCERMYTGEWTGTMCLTEPQAGSDLGDIKTKAVKRADGTYLLSGQKIFITSGDHDLTPNIVHAVLARIEGAPAGAKGLSLFAVPKFRINPDGSLGGPNDVACAGIESKLGIHGSPTCTLVFGEGGDCVGHLLGRERLGLLHMFQMMNSARFEVGVQGMATASAAHQAAVAYARERLQGRAMDDKDPHSPQVPIADHPDVRRNLLTQAAYVQAMRALLYYTGFCMDKAHVTEGDERKRYEGLTDILTPICKAWCSDWGFRVTEWAMQVYGGYGYTTEYPVEQYLRDVKIASIYEGTNGIQALDLVGRKFRLQGGALLRALLDRVAEARKAAGADPVLRACTEALDGALERFEAALSRLQSPADGVLQMHLNASPILDALGHVVAGALLFEQAALARTRLSALMRERGSGGGGPDVFRTFLAGNEEARFLHNKVQAALCFAHRALPAAVAGLDAVAAGDLSPVDAAF